MIPAFLREVPLIGIFRFVAPEVALPAAAAAARCGIRALEVTMNSAAPEALIGRLRSEVPDVVVGAGTVMSVDAVRAALAGGAQFIVCPHVDEAIIQYCAVAGVPVFPGAMTPTEIWRAHVAGATMVKLFPAATLGPAYVRALRGPFPEIDLLVTGGIDATNVRSFLEAGAAGAAVGGNLFPREALTAGTGTTVEREARRLVEATQAA